MRGVWVTVLSLTFSCAAAPEPTPRTHVARIEDDDQRAKPVPTRSRETAPAASPAVESPPSPAPQAPGARSEAETARLRASCADDRKQRQDLRRLLAESSRKHDAERDARKKLAAYVQANCKRRVVAVEGPSDRLEWDEEGYLRRQPGIVVAEIVFDCPANGPAGARGSVSMGVRRGGDDPQRVARASSTPTPTRDEVCREFDDE